MLNVQIPFTVYHSPFTMRYPFAVIHTSRLMVDGKCTVNSKWPMVNGPTIGGALGAD